MADWILIEAGKSLFAAVDDIAPDRDHDSDGSIGDTAHQHEVSDHNPDETGSVPIHDADSINEVHAVDVDNTLNFPGLTMEMIVQFILARCRSGAEKRIRYVIYYRRIWEASNGWKERPYTGASAHTEHAHFSFSYVTSLEASKAPWHLEEINVPLTLSDDQIEAIATRAAEKVWGYQLEDPTSDKTPRAKKSAGAYVRYTDALHTADRNTTIAARDAILAALQPAPEGRVG